MSLDLLFKILLALPFCAVLAVIFCPNERAAKAVAVVSGLLSLLVATFMGLCITPDIQLIINREWIPTFNIHFALGIGPVGYLMIWVAAFSTFVGTMAAMRDLTDAYSLRSIKLHFACLLLIQEALYVVFAARDLVLFFIAYETVLIPMYLLILVWGGKNRVYASMKFVLFTLFGSLPMLLGIAVIAVNTISRMGEPVFDLTALSIMGFHQPMTFLIVNYQLDNMLFVCFALAFLVKIPLWPLHTWLPDAHTEAPASGSIILAGALLKMGTYGLIAVGIPLFPAAARLAAPLIQVLACCGIIFGGMAAFAQTDGKRLIAYSSVSHMGFVVLGLFVFTVEGYLGAIMQMAAHGVATGALFYFVGAIYRRRHDRQLTSFGGLATMSPGFAAWAAIAAFASMALPGTAGFAAEVMVFYGAFITKPILVVLAIPAVIFSAAYMLKFLKAILFVDADPEFEKSWDGAHPDELGVLVFCGVVLITVGLFPYCMVYSWLEPALGALMKVVQ